jgi:hypothetical protein
MPIRFPSARPPRRATDLDPVLSAGAAARDRRLSEPSMARSQPALQARGAKFAAQAGRTALERLWGWGADKLRGASSAPAPGYLSADFIARAEQPLSPDEGTLLSSHVPTLPAGGGSPAEPMVPPPWALR